MDKYLWITSAAVFSVIGLIAGYLTNHQMTIAGAGLGCLAGLGVAAFAIAGERSGPAASPAAPRIDDSNDERS